MKDLNDIRARINEIDKKMRELFEMRMDAAREVAEYKAKNALPIFDEAREREVIKSNCEVLSDNELQPYYVEFLKTTITVSKEYQRALLEFADNADFQDTDGLKTITVQLGDRSYAVTVGHGIINRANEIFNLNRRVAIITDSGVPKEYVQAVGALCKESTVITFPMGEENKNVDTYAYICKELLSFGLQRQDAVLAIGGGVVTDIAGFCAATYMRGVDLYTIPTTTLAALDASIGGKTAIDLCSVKNPIGAFHQPKGVLIDTDTFKTLDKRLASSGYAELIKMAATSDKELFEQLEEGLLDRDPEEAIIRGLLIKKRIVEEDELEGGIRRILNFGHTLGHGIEALGGLYHGECVAIGMLPMCSSEVKNRLKALLERYSLPTAFDKDIDKALEYMRSDKKGVGDSTYAVFVDSIGEGRIESIKFKELSARIKSNL